MPTYKTCWLDENAKSIEMICLCHVCSSQPNQGLLSMSFRRPWPNWPRTRSPTCRRPWLKKSGTCCIFRLFSHTIRCVVTVGNCMMFRFVGTVSLVLPESNNGCFFMFFCCLLLPFGVAGRHLVVLMFQSKETRLRWYHCSDVDGRCFFWSLIEFCLKWPKKIKSIRSKDVRKRKMTESYLENDRNVSAKQEPASDPFACKHDRLPIVSIVNLCFCRGIDVLNQKSELSKVFQEKRREQNYQSQAKPAPELKSEFDLMLEKRRKDYEEVRERWYRSHCL